MLRIIAGARRGARIETPEGGATRPLRDRIRQALFNILQFEVEGRAVLDLFSGSGAVGLEAVSRGASRAVLVEAGADAARAIRANIAKLRFVDRARLVEGMLPDALAQAGAGPFDLAFLTPPYHSGAAWPCLGPLAGLLAPDARVVVELHKDEPQAWPPGWRVEDDRLYGVTRLVFARPPVTPGSR